MGSKKVEKFRKLLSRATGDKRFRNQCKDPDELITFLFENLFHCPPLLHFRYITVYIVCWCATASPILYFPINSNGSSVDFCDLFITLDDKRQLIGDTDTVLNVQGVFDLWLKNNHFKFEQVRPTARKHSHLTNGHRLDFSFSHSCTCT